MVGLIRKKERKKKDTEYRATQAYMNMPICVGKEP